MRVCVYVYFGAGSVNHCGVDNEFYVVSKKKKNREKKKKNFQKKINLFFRPRKVHEKIYTFLRSRADKRGACSRARRRRRLDFIIIIYTRVPDGSYNIRLQWTHLKMITRPVAGSDNDKNNNNKTYGNARIYKDKTALRKNIAFT